MPILFGIDGTGSRFKPGKSRDKKYDENFANSFVRRICDRGGPNTLYKRGPVALGGGLMDAISTGYGFIRGRQKEGFAEPIILTGYSRGAAGVVSLAKKLKRAKIEVQALMLFDCVDRHVAIDAESIPSNVRYARHVIRDPRAKSRKSFSNDAMFYFEGKTVVEGNKFLCTHGAMGGTPWERKDGQKPGDIIEESFPDGKTTVTFAQDARRSQLVWESCQKFLIKHGFVLANPKR